VTAAVEQLQFEWRKLIEVVRRGEEVRLTSKGEVVARLVGVENAKPAANKRAWLTELAGLRAQTSTGKSGVASEAILDDLRSERG